MAAQKSPAFGEYSRSFITDTVADNSTESALKLKSELHRFPEEAIYVYSFAANKMIYSDGWKDVLGYDDHEISMLLLVNSTTPEYAPFSNELNDKALMFLHGKTEHLEAYSFTIELKKTHKDGSAVPLIWRVAVFRAIGGKVVEIIGRAQVNRGLKFGLVMNYAAYGPEKDEFEEELNKALFQHYAISEREKKALSMLANGYSFKEVASHFDVTPSAIEKRIIPLYKRFGVKSLSHLVSFAYDNHILP